MTNIEMSLDGTQSPIRTHTSFSHTFIHIHSLTLLPAFCLSFPHCQTPSHTRTHTLATLPQISEYQALGFLFFAGWGNDMVLALTAVAVKQQICFTTTPFCLFVWGDGVCVVIWRCATGPQSHCHHPLALRSRHWTMFCSPHLFSISSLISFVSDWNSPLVFTSSPCLEIICHAWLSLRHDQSLVLFQFLQSCLHLPVGLSRVGKGCSGANYRNGFCAQ